MQHYQKMSKDLKAPVHVKTDFVTKLLLDLKKKRNLGKKHITFCYQAQTSKDNSHRQFTYYPLVLAELSDLSCLLLHPGNQLLQISLQFLPLLLILSCIYLMLQLLMLADKNINAHELSCQKLEKPNNMSYSQTHLSKLILQSQEQVRQRAQRLIHRWTVRLLESTERCKKFLTEVFPDSTSRPVQGAHSLTQLRLVVFHHVEDALYISMD